MTGLQRAAAVTAAAVTAAAALAVAAVLAGRALPDAPTGPGVTCYVSRAVGPCGLAQVEALRDGEAIPCAEGSEVEIVAEVVLAEGETVAAALPAGVVAIDGSSEEIPCASLKRAAKGLTIRPTHAHGPTCIAGLTATDTSEHADGSSLWRQMVDGEHVPWPCCGDRCRCEDPAECIRVGPVELSGRGLWRQRLKEAREMEASP